MTTMTTTMARILAAIPHGKTAAVILRGLPGSGKTTLAQALVRHANESLEGRSQEARRLLRATRAVSADDLFEVGGGRYAFDARRLPEAHARCFRGFVDAIRGIDESVARGDDGIVVAVSHNTATTHAEIEPYRLAALAYGVEPLVVRLDVPVETCLARQTHGVPEASVRAMAFRLREPLPPWAGEIVVAP